MLLYSTWFHLYLSLGRPLSLARRRLEHMALDRGHLVFMPFQPELVLMAGQCSMDLLSRRQWMVLQRSSPLLQ
jgi:hypothetical protein